MHRYQYDPEEGAKGVAASTPFEDIGIELALPALPRVRGLDAEQGRLP